ncbi:hypothetical protein [Spirosoma montaniterrae]|uniref:Uncharacterized protein n=1 Tax=Spirosoma montaniterrae TaxID=1178516 RepID=A0A1P9WRV8_9BACT|nr:hypothetical protein [Spirosoma montaniterrae]AQG78083.1 hypothetical protein AWR27_01170 [Spirosoma montaniterrae]
MNDEKHVERDDAQIIGRTEGPFGTDDADADVSQTDNKNRDSLEDSANGLDSLQVRGGQDGRNNRGIGSTDMDSKNGVLRMGDQDNSTMEVTEQAKESIAGSATTNTSTVDVTTAGPDDYASANQVGVPNAQQAAKAEDDENDADSDDRDSVQEDREEDVAETGTDLNNQPTY